MASTKNIGWVGVDLDGTLAHYDHWRGIEHIGEPITVMTSRVKRWLLQGKTVKIVTARLGTQLTVEQIPIVMKTIDDWCCKHIGVTLPVTCAKDFGMIELWDDRAVQVETNTGRRMDGVIEQ